MHDRSQPPVASSIQPLLTPEEVARLLSLTRLQVIRQSRAGRIPAVRIGKVWRYRPESIRAWLDEQTGAA
jgi:excisionase family DNA binding protein